MTYDFKKIEKKWQKKWEEKKIFQVKEDSKKKKYYVLDMFPYPSGEGLHIGHAFVFSLGDIFARFKRMQGYNVLYPIGYDSLGLPAENAAIKAGTHPSKYTSKSMSNFMRQQKAMGWSYDWSRLVMSHDSNFYKWDQWIFLKMFEKGLAYRKKAPVNFCSKCNTVLANEQVVNGKCWRHEDTDVEIKHLEQWFFKITDYAEELLSGLDKIDWPQRAKTMQKNWIGKSHGAEILFEIDSNISKVVLMHGKDTNSNEKWYPWFKKEVEKKGVECIVPTLPDANDPEINVWINELEKIKPDENTVLIGHSMGGVAILRWLEKLSKGKKIKKVILVATNSGDLNEENKALNNKGFFSVKGYDFEKIKSHCDNFVVIHSKDDDWIPFSAGEENAEGLDAKFSIYEDKGHFGKHVGGECGEILNEVFEKWPIFTTRPDTIYGVTFMVVSAQHPRLMELVTDKQKKDVENFLKKLKSVSEKEFEDMEKEGVFTGSYAINPINNEKVPVYAGNFVLADYGSGMVMAVPSHDQRDFEFANKYKIPIREVIAHSYGKPQKKSEFRKTISAVVHRKKDKKFLLLKWNKFDWTSPVVGGIEENEDIGKAAEREVLEETGYRVKFIRTLGGPIESHFFADNKGVWRHRLDQPVLLELLSDKPEKIDKKEKEKHGAIWLSYEEAMKKITHEYNSLGIKRYTGKDKAYTDLGVLINSGEFNGLNSNEAKEHIVKFLESKKLGKKTVNFKLRDWLISRQRYWGTPIPIIYCDKCGIVPVSKKDLPVKLPEKVNFGKGNPLTTNKSFLEVKCPKCKGKARRETDTMDTFVNSSWYYLRYTDPKNKKEIFDKKKVNYWAPVDQYIGGPEHITMHLIYIRFYAKFLRDLGLLKFDEPALKYFTQGVVKGSDGYRMSKSRGNGVEPLDMINEYGADSLRLYLISNASPDKDFYWDEKGVGGSFKFLNKVYEYFDKIKFGKTNSHIESKLNKTIKDVTIDVENFRHNLAVIKIRNLFNWFSDKTISKSNSEDFLKILHLYCPFVTEEIWEKIGNKGFISLSSWPKADEKKIDENLEKQEESIENLVSDIVHVVRILKEKENRETTKVFVYVLPNEKNNFSDNLNLIKKKTGLEVTVYAVNDKDKHDPENKSKKVKPGRPGIYLE